ncbi:other/FunK1 protein kinase [Coprinopsis cinerea AmutBmut pab1-1]|nr:other/FunK1 protein kinase [Coprinopsis cinerea AmutBmut pab1-1]
MSTRPIPSIYTIDHIIPPRDEPDIYWQSPWIYFAHNTYTNKKVVIKDFWYDGLGGCDPEPEMLDEARGVEGVVQVVEWGVVGDTAVFRGVDVFRDERIEKRVRYRIVLERYGGMIIDFESRLDLLYGLFDAITGTSSTLSCVKKSIAKTQTGHMNLYLHKQILHRDVSIGNILLGLQGFRSPKGYRGVLIDLDRSVRLKNGLGPPVDVEIGTTPWQSVFVMQSGCNLDPKVYPTGRHDHLDDLESFFWVFVFVVVAYRARGEENRVHSSKLGLRMNEWFPRGSTSSAESILGCYTAKLGFVLSEEERGFRRAEVEECVGEWWGGAVRELVSEWREFVGEVFARKSEALDDESHGDGGKMDLLRKEARVHYLRVLGMIGKAIGKMEKEEDRDGGVDSEEGDKLVLGKRSAEGCTREEPKPKKGKGEEGI